MQRNHPDSSAERRLSAQRPDVSPEDDRRRLGPQIRTLSIVAGAAILATAALRILSPVVFERFIGPLEPMLVTVTASAVALAAAPALIRRGWLILRVRTAGESRWKIPLYALPFAAVAILVDRITPFPATINVPFPLSLLFYPAAGFVAEAVAHMAPLALLLAVIARTRDRADSTGIIWISTLAVAVLEPVYQFAAMGPDALPGWAAAVVTANIYLINVVELRLFRRFDFLAMFTFRLSYYLLWHIAWGHARLSLLF